MCVASSKKIFHIVSSVVRKICLSCLSRPRCRRGLWESKNGIPLPLPRSFPCFELDRVARKTSHLFLRGDGARRRRKKKIESRVNFAGGPSASSLLRQERARAHSRSLSPRGITPPRSLSPSSSFSRGASELRTCCARSKLGHKSPREGVCTNEEGRSSEEGSDC